MQSSIGLSPVIDPNGSGLADSPVLRWRMAPYRVSCTKELLPLPETPVTRQSTPNGNATSICFRLCPLAPWRVMNPRGCAARGRGASNLAGR